MSEAISGNKRFYGMLSVDVRKHTMNVEGMSYIPWARAHALAGRPAHEALLFDGPAGKEPVRRLFGGTAVAVAIDAGEGKKQVCYLPILDLKGRPIPDGLETARDVGDAMGRCVARSIAITWGLGLSLYSLTEGDGACYVDAMCIDPTTQDIAPVAPLRDVKGKAGGRQTEYLGWHAAVAACRITDPGFTWEVVEFQQPDGSSLPATKLGGVGWMVAVKIHYRGQEHVQWLPIMGIAKVKTKNGEKPMEHQPIPEPDIMHWHQAVMRCLAKGIAIHTGYGIALYAKGDVDALEVDVGDVAQVAAEGEADPQAAPQKRVEASVPPPSSEQLAPEVSKIDALRAQVKSLLVKTASEERLFYGWLGVSRLEDAGEEKLLRGVQALDQKLQGQRRNQQQPA